jgi:hypothetical protein
MSELDPIVKNALQELDIDPKDALWYLEVANTWIMKHKYIEIIGAKKNVVIDDLVEAETNSAQGVVAIKCYAHLNGQKVITYGEASPKNNRNSYPYAIAEKRAIDRAILKLIGIHGFVYSDVDEFNEEK